MAFNECVSVHILNDQKWVEGIIAQMENRSINLSAWYILCMTVCISLFFMQWFVRLPMRSFPLLNKSNIFSFFENKITPKTVSKWGGGKGSVYCTSLLVLLVLFEKDGKEKVNSINLNLIGNSFRLFFAELTN